MTTVLTEERGCARRSVQSNSSTSASSDDFTVQQSENTGGPLPLEELLAKGCTHKDIELLRQSGYYTIECIAFAPDRSIVAVKGISEQKCEKLKAACRELIGLGFCSATDFLEARQNLIRFTTGCVDLDRILKGGIETGNITELVGEYRTGKTQLCHTLAVTCQLPVGQSGGDGRCLWIDTEGTFRPERLVAIASRFNLHTTQVLENIVYGRAFNTDHLLALLVEAAAIMAKSRFALMIVDSIICLYRSEFAGRGELAARQMHLGRKLADTFGVAVLLTNQVMAKVDGMPGQDKMPAGGHVLAHTSQTRLFVRKGKGENRICKIIDSPSLPECEAQFSITEGGISDCANS